MTLPKMTASPTTPVNAQASDTVLARIADMLATRLPARGGDPATSYVAKLFSKGPDAALKKIGEEATELVMAVKDGQADRIVAETADLWFHCLVVLTEHGLRPEQVLAELARREGVSGLQEKASRNL
jgi:phosphoribosyl-ATP pyrophosphohydrolase